MSEFLWSEWRGHVCLFIRRAHCPQITPGGLERRTLFPKIATSNPAGDSEGLNVLAAAQPYIERRGLRKDRCTALYREARPQEGLVHMCSQTPLLSEL